MSDETIIPVFLSLVAIMGSVVVLVEHYSRRIKTCTCLECRVARAPAANDDRETR